MCTGHIFITRLVTDILQSRMSPMASYTTNTFKIFVVSKWGMMAAKFKLNEFFFFSEFKFNFELFYRKLDD